MRKKLLTLMVAVVLSVGLGIYYYPSKGEAISTTFTRESTSSSGTQQSPNFASSTQGYTSQDGSLTVFVSNADNLVSGDTNNFTDLFLKNNSTGAIQRIDTDSSASVQANNTPANPRMTPDGKYIVYDSAASNLVTGDTNGFADIFLYNTATGATELISKSTSGTAGDANSYNPDVSSDGRFVTFESRSTTFSTLAWAGRTNIYVRDRTLGTTTLVTTTPAGAITNGYSSDPRISCSGRYITFDSDSTDLVTGDTNAKTDIFLVDLLGGHITSDITLGENASTVQPKISCDGNFVTYQSTATNLVASDTNSVTDIFRYDVRAASTQRVSLTSAGAQVSVNSFGPEISGDGNLIVFYASDSTGYYSGDTNGYGDVFVKNVSSGTVDIVSINSSSTLGDATSNAPSINANSSYITFSSGADNLVSGDTNSGSDLFRVATNLTPTCNY